MVWILRTPGIWKIDGFPEAMNYPHHIQIYACEPRSIVICQYDLRNLGRCIAGNNLVKLAA